MSKLRPDECRIDIKIVFSETSHDDRKIRAALKKLFKALDARNQQQKKERANCQTAKTN